jgi:hypothetical protein
MARTISNLTDRPKGIRIVGSLYLATTSEYTDSLMFAVVTSKVCR